MNKFFLFIISMFLFGTTCYSQLEHEWSFSFGGNTSGIGDQITSMDTDSSGNYYLLCKNYAATDYDPSPVTTTYGSGSYLVKYDANRNLIWVKKIGPSSSFNLGELVVDSQQNIVITGSFDNTVDFDPGPGTYELTASTPALSEAFVLKLTNNGDFIWVFKLDGTYSSIGHGLAITPTGDIYMSGAFTVEIDMDPGIGDVTYTTNSYDDGILAKYDSTGAYQWSVQLGGSSFQHAYDVALDEQLNPVVIGSHTVNTDFDPSGSTYFMPFWGGYVAKYTPSGSLIWVNGIKPASGNLTSWGTAIDDLGNIYLTGNFSDSLNVDPTGSNLTHGAIGTDDAFLVQFNSNGDFQWSDITGNNGLYYSVPELWIENNNDVIWAAAFDTVSVKCLSSTGQFKWQHFMEVNTYASVRAIERIDNKIHIAGQYRDTLLITPTDTLISLGNSDMFWSVFGVTNQAPTLSIGDSINLCKNDIITVPVSFTDEDTVGTIYSVVSGDIAIIPNGNVSLVGAGPNQMMEITSTGVSGDLYLYVTVTDTAGLNAMDSIYVTINAVDTSVSNYGTSLSANAIDASFQWFDCNTMQILTGEINDTLTPSVTGSYAVEIIQNGCVDTSSCIDVIILKVPEKNNLPSLSIYPNPVIDKVTIDLGNEQFEGTINIKNSLGQVVLSHNVNSSKKVDFEIKLPAGNYFVELISEANNIFDIRKIVIQ